MMFMFSSYYGLIRGEAGHKIVKTYTLERVLQIIGFVDYLLFLLEQTQFYFVKQE